MKQRRTQARVDGPIRQTLIQNARKKIYIENLSVTSKAVNDLLKDQSLVPTIVCVLVFSHMCPDYFIQNAFSNRLGDTGFNMFSMFVVDLMHEFELGVWKTLFTHLIRILESVDAALVCELNRR